jgi:predicted nucleic acid-binding protein
VTPSGLTSRRQVFVDTAAWLALINIDDDFHLFAKQVRKKLQQDNCSLITSDFVLLEVADALTIPRVRSQTINFINRLRNLSGLKIVPLSQSLFDAGWQLYSQRLDKNWGLTDCISFAIMQQEGMTIAFTSDKHFEQAGFTRLLKPKI